MVGLLFAFKVLVFALCAGAIIAVLIFVPLAIYVTPYTLWVGFQNNAGKHLDKKKEKNWKAAKNATKLYASWITRKKPSF
ncbi:hypothetical protein [Paenibacillus sanguinis]|uniref:hypothetical protein n=1 Tax=Paenibacillus sanguinis TaxID=225906 RepID=UPI0003780F27|nr:hypothetical protein [Paenibacillus sanguinis]